MHDDHRDDGEEEVSRSDLLGSARRRPFLKTLSTAPLAAALAGCEDGFDEGAVADGTTVPGVGETVPFGEAVAFDDGYATTMTHEGADGTGMTVEGRFVGGDYRLRVETADAVQTTYVVGEDRYLVSGDRCLKYPGGAEPLREAAEQRRAERTPQGTNGTATVSKTATTAGSTDDAQTATGEPADDSTDTRVGDGTTNGSGDETTTATGDGTPSTTAPATATERDAGLQLRLTGRTDIDGEPTLVYELTADQLGALEESLTYYVREADGRLRRIEFASGTIDYRAWGELEAIEPPGLDCREVEATPPG